MTNQAAVSIAQNGCTIGRKSVSTFQRMNRKKVIEKVTLMGSGEHGEHDDIKFVTCGHLVEE